MQLESDGIEKPKEITFPNNSAKPKIEWHLVKAIEMDKFDLMTVRISKSNEDIICAFISEPIVYEPLAISGWILPGARICVPPLEI